MTTTEPDRPSSGAERASGNNLAAPKRQRGRNVQPLRALLPYFVRRWDLIGAGIFLVLASAVSLAIPVAFRGVIDHGFAAGAAAAVDRAFLGLGVVALLMAVFSAARFYFLSKIGERVVADLRADVYDHLL